MCLGATAPNSLCQQVETEPVAGVNGRADVTGVWRRPLGE